MIKGVKFYKKIAERSEIYPDYIAVSSYDRTEKKVRVLYPELSSLRDLKQSFYLGGEVKAWENDAFIIYVDEEFVERVYLEISEAEFLAQLL